MCHATDLLVTDVLKGSENSTSRCSYSEADICNCLTLSYSIPFQLQCQSCCLDVLMNDQSRVTLSLTEKIENILLKEGKKNVLPQRFQLKAGGWYIPPSCQYSLCCAPAYMTGTGCYTSSLVVLWLLFCKSMTDNVNGVRMPNSLPQQLLQDIQTR